MSSEKGFSFFFTGCSVEFVLFVALDKKWCMIIGCLLIVLDFEAFSWTSLCYINSSGSSQLSSWFFSMESWDWFSRIFTGGLFPLLCWIVFLWRNGRLCAFVVKSRRRNISSPSLRRINWQKTWCQLLKSINRVTRVKNGRRVYTR